jgi:5-dehydro-2-deoxygluconokinase
MGRRVLVVDVGGSGVKILATGQQARRKFLSGPTLTPEQMVAGVRQTADGWDYDVVSIGYPGPVRQGKPAVEPFNLGRGWVGFDFGAAFGLPVRIVNDAAMQALGSYEGGRMLFLGLGTGLGSAMVLDRVLQPMELAHLPYRRGTFEDYVGERGLERLGKKKWRRRVADVVERLYAALWPDYVVLGGGNVRLLKELPPNCRAGDNGNAFQGGFRLWEEAGGPAGGGERIPRPETLQREGVPTMNVGYDKPLYILPFDHRGSFQTKMFGWKGNLTAEQTAEIAAAKRVIYDGFKAAVAAGVPKEKAGILVDEQFGADCLRDAARSGYITAMPAEKSGQDEFDFEYGEEFAQHIEEFKPTFCKVLVRYNPESERTLNQRQAARLKRLSDYLHGARRLYMFELLVPAEKAQLDRVGGDKKAYDVEVRPGLMVRAIQELQDAGVEADVWKIEGLDRREDCARVVAAARRGGRDKVGCIVLGRGEDDRKVREWLGTAAGVPGFIGFAVGRTTFWDPCVDWRAKRVTREAAVAEIARRYREWVDIFEKARAR